MKTASMILGAKHAVEQALETPDTADAIHSLESIIHQYQDIFNDLKEELNRLRKQDLLDLTSSAGSGGGGGRICVDIGFVVDVTGSMGPYLGEVKTQINH